MGAYYTDALFEELQGTISCDLIAYFVRSQLSEESWYRIYDTAAGEVVSQYMSVPFLMRMACKRPGETVRLSRFIGKDMFKRTPYFIDQCRLFGYENWLATGLQFTDPNVCICVMIGRQDSDDHFSDAELALKQRLVLDVSVELEKVRMDSLKDWKAPM